MARRPKKAQAVPTDAVREALQQRVAPGVKVLDVDISDPVKKTVTLDMSESPASVRRAIGSGYIFNRYNPIERAGWYSSFTSDILPFTRAMQLPSNPHDIMKLATELYLSDEFIGTAIDMMVDFSAQGLEIECEDREVKEWFEQWMEDVNLAGLMSPIFLDYYRVANVYITREFDEEGIPVAYSLLDPIQTEVLGPLVFGQEEIALNLSRELVDMVSNPTLQSASHLERIPAEMIEKIRPGSNRYIIPPEKVSRITRKKQPYERYATTLLNKVFWPALYKQKTRLMDLSVVEGTMNQILKITIGNDEYPATQEDLVRVSELFQTPQKSFIVVYNHTLQMEFVTPKGLENLDAKKYDPLNQEILAGLGIPRVLIDGTSGFTSSAAGWLSTLGVMEKLEAARSDVLRWLRQEFRQVAQAKGFKAVPTPKFRKLNLRSDQTFKNVLLALYDRGLLSQESILDQANFSYDIELERKKEEQPNAQYFMPAKLPYYGGSSNQQVGPPNQGRPSGTTDNDYSERPVIPNTPRMGQGSKEDEEYSGDPYLDQAIWQYQQDNMDRWEQMQRDLSALDNDTTTDSHKKKHELEILLAAFAIQWKRMSDLYLSEIFLHYYRNYQADTTHFAETKRHELTEWQDRYADRFVHELADVLEQAESHGEPLALAWDRFTPRARLYAEAGGANARLRGTMAGLVARGHTQVRWRAVLDDRTCAECRARDGQIYERDYLPDIVHPHCRCTVEPV